MNGEKIFFLTAIGGGVMLGLALLATAATLGAEEKRLLSNMIREVKVPTPHGIFTVQVFEVLIGDNFGIELLDPNGEKLEVGGTSAQTQFDTEDDAIEAGKLLVHMIALQRQQDDIFAEFNKLVVT